MVNFLALVNVYVCLSGSLLPKRLSRRSGSMSTKIQKSLKGLEGLGAFNHSFTQAFKIRKPPFEQHMLEFNFLLIHLSLTN